MPKLKQVNGYVGFDAQNFSFSLQLQISCFLFLEAYPNIWPLCLEPKLSECQHNHIQDLKVTHNIPSRKIIITRVLVNRKYYDLN